MDGFDESKIINLEATDKEELLKIIEHWKSKCLEVDKKYETLEKKFEDSTKNNPSTCSCNDSETIPALRSEVNEMQNTLKKALDGFNSLHAIVNSSSENKNKERIEMLDQYGRKNSLVLLKLRVPTGKYGIDFIIWIVKKLNELFPDLVEPVQICHIDDAHPLKDLEDGTPVIIIKFACRWVKSEIYKRRASLKGNDISISEQLTPYTRSLLDNIKSLVGKDTKVYTNNCVINFKFNNRKYYIRSFKDLQAVAKQLGKTAPAPGLKLSPNSPDPPNSFAGSYNPQQFQNLPSNPANIVADAFNYEYVPYQGDHQLYFFF